MTLSEYATTDIVDELKKREGVDTQTVEPYDEKVVSAEGPSVVLIVTD